jgi:hypothetical protein
MSNLQINPELPLKEFKKQIPTKKYNDILQLRVLESDFDNTMEQYQRTFQTYLSYTRQQVEYEWRSRYPVEVNNMDAQINQRFPGNVTKDECFANCANDSKCKYVLWSNTGPSYCAPNKCKKFTNSGGGMRSSDGIVESNPMCAADLLWAEVDAELENPFFGWENFPSLERQFPTETNYKYHGWEKPEWNKYENTSTQNARWSGNNWDPLDDADTVDKCNQLAQESSKGPFDWTIHNGKQCSAHKLGGLSVGGNITVSGQTLSKPPGGQTGMIIASRVSTVNQLKALNARLLTLMQQIYTLSVKIYPKGINNKVQSKYELERIRKKNKRLLADRQRIEELSSNLSDLDGQNESLKLQHDANQLLYLGMSVLLVGVAGITYKVVSSKSN